MPWLDALSPNVETALVLLVGVLAVLVAAGRVPWSYNLRNLLVRWRTTLLTAAAFTLVVGLLTVMLAFVNGMEQLTRGSGQPGNVVILSEGVTDEVFSNLGFSDVGDLANQPGILRAGDRPLVSRETYLIVNQPIASPRAGRPARRFLQLRGVDEPEISGQVHGLPLFPGGTWFSAAGVRDLPDQGGGSAAIEAVLGEGLARELAADRSAEAASRARDPRRLDVGDTFELNFRTWVVVGVMQSAGTTFDSELWAKRSLVGPMFSKDSYSSLVARTAGPAEALRLKEFLNTSYDKAAVNAELETKYFANLNATNEQFLYSIGFLTVVIAVGGVFGVMNTMFAAISQRTRDIGVMRLLGYTRRHILVAFLMESMMIAAIGGGLGCLVGSLAHGWQANSIVSSGAGGGKTVMLRLVVDANTLVLGLVLALAMGLVGGLFPALRAIRMRMLDSLR